MIDPEVRKHWFDKLGYTPHTPKQLEIHENNARFKVLACGRRYGKTTMGGNELTVAMLDPHHPGYYWIVGPKYTTAEKEFRVVYNNIFKKLKLSNDSRFKKSYNVKQGDMRIETPWGSLLEVKSAQHQDTLLGEGLAGVIMSEAARHSSETWESYVRPALSDIGADGKRGWAIFASTPRGYNWYQGLWLLGQSNQFGDFASWRLPSWENPLVYPGGYNDPEILQIKKEVTDSWFQQEICAEFTAFAGKIYPQFNRETHVKRIEYNPMWTNVWALDYGWANPFVCLDVMIDPEENIYVWREYMVSEKSTMDHAWILRGRADDPEGYHVDWGGGDPRGPDPANTITSITGVQIYSEDIASRADESWKLGVEYVGRKLKIRENGKPQLYIDPSCENLIRQMEQLHTPETNDGVNSREGQHKYDDHGPDALRYLIGQWLHSGAGSSLSDVYAPGKQTEAATYFQQTAHLARYGRY